MSENTKHTPGPWAITDEHNKSIFIEGQPDEWARLFCEVSKDDCDTETAKANARLIAAAPALLEALEALYAATPDCGDGPLGQACMKARAAIAKATAAADRG